MKEFFCDIKGKRKEMYGDGSAMKDKGKKETKTGLFKKKCVTAKCESGNKLRTGICYSKIGACFKCSQLGSPEQMNFGMV